MEQLQYTVNAKNVKDKITNKTKTQVWVNFLNLRPEDIKFIKDRINYDGKTRCYEKNGELSVMTLNPNNPRDVYTKNILGVVRLIAYTKKYEIPSEQTFLEDISSALNDVITSQDVKDSNKNADELWIKFMKHLENPKVQLLLKSMGQYTLAKTTYGWKISARNLMRALAAKPTCTFVQTRASWAKKYGRRIKPNATKIILQFPLATHSPTQDDMKKQMNLVGYGDNVAFNDLSQQQQDFIKISSYDNDAKSFYNIVYYDVSDTELIYPNGVDRWALEVGYDNNLTGHLNKAAIEQQAKNMSVSNKVADEIYHGEGGNLKELTTALAKGIAAKYPSINTNIPKGDDPDLYIKSYHDMLSSLADVLIEEKGKVVKKENREQGIDIAVTIVMCLTRVNAAYVAHRLRNNELTRDCYFELRNVINSIIDLIEQYSVKKESKIIKLHEMQLHKLESVDELLGMMGMTMDDVKDTSSSLANESTSSIRTLKEQFDNMLRRINESDKNRAEWRER